MTPALTPASLFPTTPQALESPKDLSEKRHVARSRKIPPDVTDSILPTHLSPTEQIHHRDNCYMHSARRTARWRRDSEYQIDDRGDHQYSCKWLMAYDTQHISPLLTPENDDDALACQRPQAYGIEHKAHCLAPGFYRSVGRDNYRRSLPCVPFCSA